MLGYRQRNITRPLDYDYESQQLHINCEEAKYDNDKKKLSKSKCKKCYKITSNIINLFGLVNVTYNLCMYLKEYIKPEEKSRV